MCRYFLKVLSLRICLLHIANYDPCVLFMRCWHIHFVLCVYERSAFLKCMRSKVILQILGGNSSNSRKTFTVQKKMIRIMVGPRPRTPCTHLFKKLEVLPVPCQYIFSSINLFVSNQNVQTSPSVRSIDTKNKHHLYRPIANLSCFQKSAFYSGIRIFNNLPYSVTNLQNEKAQFKVALRRDLNGTLLLLCR
jgi:hypothetical protein